MKTAALMCVLMLAACGGFQPSGIISEPSKRISLREAFTSAADGIVAFRQTLEKNDVRLGMIVCKIEVSFNVSAEATSDNNAGLAVAAPISTASVGGDLNVSNSSSASRGNNVSFLLGSEYPELCGYPQSTSSQTANPATAAQTARATSKDQAPADNKPASLQPPAPASKGGQGTGTQGG